MTFILKRQSSGNQAPIRKGRNEDLLLDRNKAVLHRCWFYKTNLPIDIIKSKGIMGIVASEFYLSMFTVNSIITSDENKKIIEQIETEKPTPETLKELYPQYNWDVKTAIDNIFHK